MKRIKTDADRAAMRSRKRERKAYERKYLGGPMRVTLLPGKNWKPLFRLTADVQRAATGFAKTARVSREALLVMDAMAQALRAARAR